LLPLDAAALYGAGAVAEGRDQKYLGALNGCPIKREPSTLPSCSIGLPDRLDAGERQEHPAEPVDQ